MSNFSFQQNAENCTARRRTHCTARRKAAGKKDVARPAIVSQAAPRCVSADVADVRIRFHNIRANLEQLELNVEAERLVGGQLVLLMHRRHPRIVAADAHLRGQQTQEHVTRLRQLILM